MAPSAPPPTPQEIQRKLSVHSKPKKSLSPPIAGVSGTESDSDPCMSPELHSPLSQGLSPGGILVAGSAAQPPLSSIAERDAISGEESDEDDEEGGWHQGQVGISRATQGSTDEGVIKAGYLWKKGERRKTWKKRWFVLRPAHIAYYKTSAEYQLLRLLDLSDVHSCTPVTLKKHNNTFGLVSVVRTFYLQAETAEEVHSWVQAISTAREALMATSTQTSFSTPPVPIPGANTHPRQAPTPSPSSHPSYAQNITSSDSEDGSPRAARAYSSSSQNPPPTITASPSKPSSASKEASKVVISGYLMKCGAKRHNWRKRWFVLQSEKLVYSTSHMDTKPHRQFSFSEILDALEFDMRAHKHAPAAPPTPSSSHLASGAADDSSNAGPHTFKIVTTKRTLLLCAPSEEEEIKWLSAVRALIARRTGAGVVPGEPSGASQGAKGSGSGGLSDAGGSSGGAAIRQKYRNKSFSSQGGTPPVGLVGEDGTERKT
ncbi:PH-domain-containing protein [Coniophora puteana RWD-64-598 SS2]|uniref:PH-domain-containing protein n=1 Tax=Coniophora puteana (strain RWD-64-598) TaxID=741705 RepID=A0A5M3N093_CONPW|nr:PH-domain-containing protein [Coniophora puteana RWD-64-598 SS2]EIW84311.1 PH-domain-containing protein [Coniophora puteana RWD-64-598 SS2]